MYWILKTEPSTFSLDDLCRAETTMWDGVRNFQARNNLKSMKVGDLALIYHSVSEKRLVGIAKVIEPATKDVTASDGDWVAVKVAFVRPLKNPISLAALKNEKGLLSLSLLRQGRLSVCPVSHDEWQIIMHMAER